MGMIVAAFLVIGVTTILAVYSGLALWVLWGWFIVPLGMPPIGIAWAIGLGCVAALLTPTPSSDPDEAHNHLLAIILKPVMAMSVGFIAKSFM